MYIYIFLIFIIVILFTVIKNKKKALFISFVLMTIVAMLRKYTVGVDTSQFFNDFTRIISNNSWDFLNFRYELGFFYLCKFLGTMCSDGQVLIIITSIFINYSVYRFIKKNSPNYLLSTLLYILMNCYFSNMNIMRQAIALAILLLGYNFLKEKKVFNYLIFVLLASMFHTVSFASLLLLFFYILPNKKSVYYFEIILAMVTFIFYKQFFSILSLGLGYNGYADTVFGESNYFGSLIIALELLFIISFLFMFSYNKNNKYKNDNTRILTISVILYIWFSFLVVRMNIFNRISSLFSIYSIILIPILLEKMKNNNINNYKLSKIICILIFAISFLVIMIYRPEWHGTIPYYFYWE